MVLDCAEHVHGKQAVMLFNTPLGWLMPSSDVSSCSTAADTPEIAGPLTPTGIQTDVNENLAKLEGRYACNPIHGLCLAQHAAIVGYSSQDCC